MEVALQALHGLPMFGGQNIGLVIQQKQGFSPQPLPHTVLNSAECSTLQYFFPLLFSVWSLTPKLSKPTQVLSQKKKKVQTFLMICLSP